MLARFLESDTKANILSTPNLVTLDNEEAKIVVGRNVPFVTGTYATTGNTATANPFTTVERRDVGLTLKVKPQISEGGTVRLQIYQEASSVIDSTATSTTGPHYHQALHRIHRAGGRRRHDRPGWSGGRHLQRAARRKSRCLATFPILASSSATTRASAARTNLIVFLRPVILRDAASIQGISADRYNYVIGQQRANDRADALMRGETNPPQLPPPGSPPPAVPYNRPQEPLPPSPQVVPHVPQQAGPTYTP
jgi:general secretion pathway protein D